MFNKELLKGFVQNQTQKLMMQQLKEEAKMQQSQQMPPENPMQEFMQMAGTTGIGRAALSRASKVTDSNRLLSLLNLADKEFKSQQYTPVQLVEYLNDNDATPEDIWGLFRYYGVDNPMVQDMIKTTLGVQPETYTNFDSVKQRATGGVYRALGGTSDGCPEGFYYDANTGDCLPIPEEVGGRPASAYNPSSLQGFLERGSAREKTLSDLTGNLNLSQEELKQLELDLKNEYADVERKRQNILTQAKNQEALHETVSSKVRKDPVYSEFWRAYLHAGNPTEARAAIKAMPSDMRDALVRNGNIGIAADPDARGIMCASGVCDVALNAGYDIPFIPGNVGFIEYAKKNPQWQIIDQNNLQPGDIYSATGWAPNTYRPAPGQKQIEVLRGHDLSIVGEQDQNLIKQWKQVYGRNRTSAKPIVMYGNQGEDLGFHKFIRAMWPKSEVLALTGDDRGTKDYGTVMRYIGDTGILQDEISDQNTLINTLQSNIQDADANMPFAGLPLLRAQQLDVDLPELELVEMQRRLEEEKRRKKGMTRLRRPYKFT